MKESAARVWKKIAVFYLLTLALTHVFDLAEIRGAENILYTTGAMWCPALAAFATKRLFGESVRELGWQWGSGRYQLWAYLLPIAYALPVYLSVWLTGLGGFYDTEFVKKTAAEMGWTGMPAAAVLVLYILISATVSLIPKTSRALGEEIGWRGFLVPELAKVVSFSGVGLISGVMWALWHFPVILFSTYHSRAPLWYSIPCFTTMIVGMSFIAAWLRLKSGNLWSAAILHGSHNLFIQLVFTPLTTDTGPTPWIIDEFGAGLAITCVIGAIVVWMKQRQTIPAEATLAEKL